MVETDALYSLAARRRMDEASLALVNGDVAGLVATQLKEEQVARQ